MIKIQDDEIIVDIETERLEGFRLEDTAKAPMIIIFTDQDEPQSISLPQGTTTVPTKLRSKNKEAEIQIISVDEIQSTLAARS